MQSAVVLENKTVFWAPEEAIRINKQILILDPGDMPAQQRLDEAQATPRSRP
jgi:hypothetical protein